MSAYQVKEIRVKSKRTFEATLIEHGWFTSKEVEVHGRILTNDNRVEADKVQFKKNTEFVPGEVEIALTTLLIQLQDINTRE